MSTNISSKMLAELFNQFTLTGEWIEGTAPLSATEVVVADNSFAVCAGWHLGEMPKRKVATDGDFNVNFHAFEVGLPAFGKVWARVSCTHTLRIAVAAWNEGSYWAFTEVREFDCKPDNADEKIREWIRVHYSILEC